MIRGRSAERGFTLIEVLLATVLLAAGMALAFATVRSTLAISTRGETLAAGSERMRGVESFLRRRLVAAMPLPMERDPATGVGIAFSGDEQHMRFVADVPGYLGRGGPYVHALEVSERDGLKQLRIGLTLLQAGHLVEENPPRGTELLADGLEQVQFRYRGIDPTTRQLGDWQRQWREAGRMPLLVSVEITPAAGRAWPPLVVTLPQRSEFGGLR